MNIGRNDRCFCGSGKKYKYCCMVKHQLDKQLKNSRIRQCVHPNKNECAKKIKKAHSIQNNKILTQIARDGEITMADFEANEYVFKVIMKPKGRAIATTFSAFCDYHDSIVFSPIENNDYQGTDQQNFLFAYRAFAYEYHSKLEAFEMHKSASAPTNPESRFIADSVSKGYNFSERDLEYCKKVLDEAIIAGNYNIINTIALQFNGATKVAVCSGFYLEYDLEGNRLNNMASPDRLKMLILNIFPQNNTTFALFSWLREDNDFYEVFKQQLLSLGSSEQLQFLNNLIPNHCINVAIGPDLWDSFALSEQEEFLIILNNTVNPLIPDDFQKKNLLTTTRVDLFKGILPA